MGFLNMQTFKAGAGVAIGWLIYMSFVKPNVPFLRNG